MQPCAHLVAVEIEQLQLRGAPVRRQRRETVEAQVDFLQMWQQLQVRDLPDHVVRQVQALQTRVIGRDLRNELPRERLERHVRWFGSLSAPNSI